MSPTAEQMILDRLGEMDGKLDQHTASIAEIKADVKNLAGNGQPGRVGKLEIAVEDLKQSRWMIAGGLVLLGVLIGLAVKFL